MTPEVVTVVDACRAQLHALDAHELSARPDLAADVRRALAALERLGARLRASADKQLYRVLEAVRAGYDTSDLIAAHLQISRWCVTRDLHTLYKAGTLTRLKEPQRRRGRPSYRYRITASA